MNRSSMLLVLVLLGVMLTAHSAPRVSAQSASSDVSGEWLLSGNVDAPCAIFRHGVVLLLVNERGDLATGRMEGRGKLIVNKGAQWQAGVTAEVQDGGRSLLWRDGSVWSRR